MKPGVVMVKVPLQQQKWLYKFLLQGYFINVQLKSYLSLFLVFVPEKDRVSPEDSAHHKTKKDEDKLRLIRSEFIERVSAEGLNKIVDKLLERHIIIDVEMESGTCETKSRANKVRCIIDTVRRKGNDACRHLLDVLKEVDPTLFRVLVPNEAKKPLKKLMSCGAKVSRYSVKSWNDQFL